MEVLRPRSLEEALLQKLELPEAVVLAGGTDLMVELNFDRRRPAAIMDVTRVPELIRWWRDDGRIRLGAGVTYTRIVAELHRELPGLAIASRTVGSPQIRNRGTVGGNLGTSSPAGDALPPLMACDARIEVASTRGARVLPLEEFLQGPKRNALAPDEIIVAVDAPVAAGGQQFSKIGTRNAMVIAVAAFALAVDTHARAIRTGIGSAGPTILRADEAESFIASALTEAAAWEGYKPIAESTVDRFGELVATAARPIDDVRGTAGYRRHALGVMARRTLRWAWADCARSW